MTKIEKSKNSNKQYKHMQVLKAQTCIVIPVIKNGRIIFDISLIFPGEKFNYMQVRRYMQDKKLHNNSAQNIRFSNLALQDLEVQTYKLQASNTYAYNFIFVPLVTDFNITARIRVFMYKDVHVSLTNHLILADKFIADEILADEKSLTQYITKHMTRDMTQFEKFGMTFSDMTYMTFFENAFKPMSNKARTNSNDMTNLASATKKADFVNTSHTAKIMVDYRIIQFAGEVTVIPKFDLLPAHIQAEHALVVYRLTKEQQAYLLNRQINVEYLYD